MKYNLEISADQARILRNACEFYSRVGMGQFDYLLDELGHIPGDEPKELCDRLHVLMTGLPPNAYKSISAAPERFRVAWDIVQVVRKQLYDDSGHKPKGSPLVDSDPPRRQSEHEDLAKIGKVVA